ncbi:MAG: nucleotidyltransferase domain-containing protein [Actinomycetota bacterium]
MECSPRLRAPSRVGELLCLLARTSLGETALSRARTLLGEGVDWDQLTALAERHGVTPLCFRSLSGSLAEQTPPDVLAGLRHAYHRNALLNLRRTQELKRVVGIFQESGIPVLALKGPVLSQLAYGDPGMRTYGDLDLLAPKERLQDAIAALRADGYLRLWALSEAQEACVMRYGYHYNLVCPQRASNLEVHWRLIDQSFALSLTQKALWSRRMGVRLGRDVVETLGAEDQLQYLCLHGAKHFWSALKLVSDVAELIRSCPNLDWDAVWRRAATSHTEQVLRLGLTLARDLLDAPIADQALPPLKDTGAMTSLGRQAIRVLFRRDDEAVPVARMVGFHLSLLPTFALKAQYLRASLAPKELDILTFRLPTRCASLYVLLRPLRLLLRLKPPVSDHTVIASSDS